MGNTISNIFTCILALTGILIWIGIMIRVFKDRFSKEKEVDAIIVDKQCYAKRVYSKSQDPYTKKEYVITFLCNKKKMCFDVSEFSYKGYKINQKGKLVYKGNRIIDFK